MSSEYKTGSILKRGDSNKYAKIISYRKNLYGLSRWTDLKNAVKSTRSEKHINKYGLLNLKVKEYTTAVLKKKKVVAPTIVEKEKPTKTALNKMNAKEVRNLAKELGVDTTGNKQDIIKSIILL